MLTVSISGDESDPRAVEAATWALHEVVAKPHGGSWGVGGSQEIASQEASLTLDAETYVGLTLSGPAALVMRVARLAADRFSAAPAAGLARR